MRLTIHGPNLYRVPNGATFVVHTAECQDNGREIVRNGSERSLDVDCPSRCAVCNVIYTLSEYETEPSAWLSDFHFAPCCHDLPLGEPTDGLEGEVAA